MYKNIQLYLSIDFLPRRPNHDLTHLSFQVSLLFDIFFDQKLVLARSWGLLGASSPRLAAS